MQARPSVAAAVVLGTLAIAGCRDDPTAPSDPATPAPDVALTAAATTLAFWQVSSGNVHTCAVAAADSLAWCWGTNDEGQLGTGSIVTTDECVGAAGAFPCSTTPVRVAGSRKFRSISVGYIHTCAVTKDFYAWCWGDNETGQLGVGTRIQRSATPLPVGGGLRFRQVDAGAFHTCGVTYPDNRLFCWGYNQSGQLGDGTLSPRWTPVKPLGGLIVRQVASGYSHSCALTTLNRAYCWGYNNDGELGDTTRARRTKPVKVVGGHAFRQIDAGNYHTCAVTTDARAFCWGSGSWGQIGDGKTHLSLWPRPVSGKLSAARVTTGGYHTCAETLSKQAYCWGNNSFGQIGNGQMGAGLAVLTPVAVVGGLAVAQMSAGIWHTCAKTTAGVGYCWGYDFFAQLGDGRSAFGAWSPVPVPVATPQ